ncbi:MAG: hypothetical protein Q4Q22_04395, partial [Methanosphaera sp.]|nr:hypothetical protein [Methanosphaera sp.]
MTATLLFVMVLLLSVSCVVAVGDNTTIAGHENQVTSAGHENPAISTGYDTDIIRDEGSTATRPTSADHIAKDSSKNIRESSYTVNNYDDMYNIITSNNTQKSMEINLKGSNSYTLTKPIVFDGSIYATTLIINGNGRTLDAKNKSIFMNISYAKTVTINNLTIINTNSKKSSTFSNNGTLTLNGCSFTDNSIKEGGLIFNRATLNMDGCNINNTIMDTEEFIIEYPNAKGSIINYGAAYITNSRISNIASGSASFADNYAYLYMKNNTLNNSASDFGTIISHIYSVAVMENNVFSNCTSTYGGVISNHGVVTIKNNKFYSNRASVGGVLYNNGNVTFTSNTLKNNEASLAGCIYNERFVDKNTGDVYGFINCTKNKFTSNKATIGAVLSNYADINFEVNTASGNYASDDNFFENDGKASGTAIIDNNARMNILNNSFVSNVAASCAVLYNG